MSKPSTKRGDCAKAFTVLAGVLLAVALLIGTAWQAKRAEYAEALRENQAALDRYRKALSQRPGLERALRDPQATKRVRDLFLVGDTPALAGARLQAQLRGLIEDAGGRLESSQILKQKDDAEGALRQLTLQVRMRCGAPAMLEVLHRLESQTPLLHVDTLSISASRAGNNTEFVLQFQITGFLFPESQPT
jgi:hypothetical protein